MQTMRVAAFALALAAATTGCGESNCDSGDLSAALSEAGPGDTVEVGECRVTGTFTVPEGVTLRGAGAGSTVLVASGGPAIAAGPATGRVRIEALSIESDGEAGIRASGAGSLELAGVTVRATRGVGIQAMGLASARLEDVSVEGPVTPDNATAVPSGPSATDTATHGIFFDTVGRETTPAVLARVTVRGFAVIGATFQSSVVDWTGGGVTQSLGTGVLVHGGSATLAELEIRGMLQGIQPLPSYGAVFTSGANITTRALEIDDNEGYGILQDQSSASHMDLLAIGNQEPALWTQSSTGLEVGGATMIASNSLAGIVVIASTDVSITGAHIEMSALATRILGETGEIQVGDGLHLVVDATETIHLADVSLAGNARAGVLFDFLAATIDPSVCERVTVDASGTALGAIAQNASGALAAGAGWDSGVTRLGDALANDTAFHSRLDVLGAVGPMFLPR